MSFAPFAYPFFSILAIGGAFFLFWRACRHELLESQDAFDLSLIGALGALVGARVFEFAARFSEFNWSLSKFLFFNAYPGFDFYGALVGMFLAISLAARAKKLNVFGTLDLLAAPLVFAQLLISLGRSTTVEPPANYVWLFFALGFGVIFWFLKRLAKTKRHRGFFISFYLVSTSIVEIVLFPWRDDVLFIAGVPYQLVAPLVIMQASLIFWYIVSERNFPHDLKSIFANFLLSMFRFRRMIADVNEAGKFSRSIILGPLWLAREIVIILKLIAREIYLGFIDFLHVLGVRR